MEISNTELITIGFFHPIFIQKYHCPLRTNDFKDFFSDMQIENNDEAIRESLYGCGQSLNAYIVEFYGRNDRELSIKGNIDNTLKNELIKVLFQASKSSSNQSKLSLLDGLSKEDKSNVYKVMEHIKSDENLSDFFKQLEDTVKHYLYDEYKQYKQDLKEKPKHFIKEKGNKTG